MKRSAALQPLKEIAREHGWLSCLDTATQNAIKENNAFIAEKMREVRAFLMASDAEVDPRSFSMEGLVERASAPTVSRSLKQECSARGWLAAITDAKWSAKTSHPDIVEQLTEVHRFLATNNLEAGSMPTLLGRWETRGQKHWFELIEEQSPTIGLHWSYCGDGCGGGFGGPAELGWNRELAFAEIARRVHMARTIDGINMSLVANPYELQAPQFPKGQWVSRLAQLPELALQIEVQKLVSLAEMKGCPEDALDDLLHDTAEDAAADRNLLSDTVLDDKGDAEVLLDANSKVASSINNQGIDAQIRWLILNGVEPKVIADHLDDSIPTASLDML